MYFLLVVKGFGASWNLCNIFAHHPFHCDCDLIRVVFVQQPTRKQTCREQRCDGEWRRRCMLTDKHKQHLGWIGNGRGNGNGNGNPGEHPINAYYTTTDVRARARDCVPVRWIPGCFCRGSWQLVSSAARQPGSPFRYQEVLRSLGASSVESVSSEFLFTAVAIVFAVIIIATLRCCYVIPNQTEAYTPHMAIVIQGKVLRVVLVLLIFIVIPPLVILVLLSAQVLWQIRFERHSRRPFGYVRASRCTWRN